MKSLSFEAMEIERKIEKISMEKDEYILLFPSHIQDILKQRRLLAIEYLKIFSIERNEKKIMLTESILYCNYRLKEYLTII